MPENFSLPRRIMVVGAATLAAAGLVPLPTVAGDERVDIVIPVEGAQLAAWLYRPSGTGPYPLVVMSHGFGAVKEMSLDRTAALLRAAGFAVLVYDHRNFGASGGVIRQEADPWQQVRDMHDVVSFALTQQGIDRDHIAVWGTSYSGGHVLVLGAIDRRVRCVIAQTPFVSGAATFERTFSETQRAPMLAAIAADRQARIRGEAPVRVPISQPGDESHTWSTVAGVGTRYRNEITLKSLDMLAAYEPIAYVERIAPTPLLIIAAEHDTRSFTDLQLQAFRRAAEPKHLVLLDGGHYDPYDRHLVRSAEAVIDFLRGCLASRGTGSGRL